MPRPRKKLSEQKGNLTVEQQNQKLQEEKNAKGSDDKLDKPPAYLSGKAAREEWKNIVSELREKTLISNLDIGALAVYCNAFNDYIEVTKKCKKEDKIIERPNKNGDMIKQINPLITLQQKYAEEMRKSAAKCGIDINSRLKAATIKISEQEKEIEETFGAI